MTRLDKFLTGMSIGTRSEVKKIIKSGRITVNGDIALKPEQKIDENTDIVCVDNEKIAYCQYEYFMLNKPAGYVSAVADSHYPTVVELIDKHVKSDIFPVGRLDIDTEGLLIITNDGEMAHNLLSPKKHVDKTYFLISEGIIPEENIRKLETGVDIGDDRLTMPARIEKIIYCSFNELSSHQQKIIENKGADRYQENSCKVNKGTDRYQEDSCKVNKDTDRYQENSCKVNKGADSRYKENNNKEIRDAEKIINQELHKFSLINITIQEGRYHQVKRMIRAVGGEVLYLKRIKMGDLELDKKLDYGEYRKLTNGEVKRLK